MTKKSSNDLFTKEGSDLTNKSISIYPGNNLDEGNKDNPNFILNLVRLASARVAYKKQGYLSQVLKDLKEDN